MTELKTWKDLLNEGVITQEQYERGQAEAVKWVKHYCNEWMNADDDTRCEIKLSIDWIKYFFNITEEENAK